MHVAHSPDSGKHAEGAGSSLTPGGTCQPTVGHAYKHLCQVYVDGSCATNKLSAKCRTSTGWGFVVVVVAVVVIHYYISQDFGPVILDRNNHWFLGAAVFSNNSKELSALHKAFLFFQSVAHGEDELRILYVSSFACFSALGIF